MALVTGTLIDFGLTPMEGFAPRLIFRATSPGLSGIAVLASRPVEVVPAANGYFEVELTPTAEVSPPMQYTIQLQWLEVNPDRKTRTETLPWKLEVPAAGGILTDLLRIPSNPALAWSGEEPPANPSPGSWWLQPSTGTLSEFDGTGWANKAELRGPAGFSATGAAEDNAAVAGFVSGAAGSSPTRDALLADFVQRVDDRGYASLQAAVDATPTGGTLEIRRQWTIAAAVNIARAMTITCARGGTVTTTGPNVSAFNVTTSDVRFDRAAIIGAGFDSAGSAAGIKVVGTEAAPVLNLRVTRSSIRNFHKYGIEATSVKDFEITHNHIENIAYGGIMILAGARGKVSFNTVKNIAQPAGYVNSYGIAMTRDAAKSLADSPRSAWIDCSHNIIDGVAKWEGIDTHGGEFLTITNNNISNTYIGIALVPCPDTTGAETYAPKNIKVSDNTIDSGKLDGTARAGIQLVGCITTVDNVVEYASATISDNTVRNYGTQNTSSQSAIFLQATRGAIVSDNRVVNASPNGINLNNNNQAALILDNLFIDTWTTNTSFTACVYFAGLHQTATVQGNRAARADKAATLVNNRGLFLGTNLTSPDVAVQYGINHFKDCTLPLIDSPTNQNITEQRVDARKLSFYPGITPIARQALVAAATDAATTQTLANDLRAKLILTGLFS